MLYRFYRFIRTLLSCGMTGNERLLCRFDGTQLVDANKIMIYMTGIMPGRGWIRLSTYLAYRNMAMGERDMVVIRHHDFDPAGSMRVLIPNEDSYQIVAHSLCFSPGDWLWCWEEYRADMLSKAKLEDADENE